MSNVRFETKRLIARHWTLDDAAAAFALYGDPEVVRYLGNLKPLENVDAVKEYLGRVLDRYGPDHSYGMWALEEKNSGIVVGSTLLKPLPEHEEIEVGWHLARSYWGKGYATESARAAIDYGFGELGLESIYAVVFPENSRSINVTKRLGMKPLGKTTDYYGFELELFRTDRPARAS